MSIYIADKAGLRGMYRAAYWGTLFNRRTSFGAKWLATRSLWITRNWWKD